MSSQKDPIILIWIRYFLICPSIWSIFRPRSRPPMLGRCWGFFLANWVAQGGCGHLGGSARASLYRLFWNILGIILKSFSGYFEIFLGSSWGHFQVILKYSWDHFGVIFRLAGLPKGFEFPMHTPCEFLTWSSGMNFVVNSNVDFAVDFRWISRGFFCT